MHMDFHFKDFIKSIWGVLIVITIISAILTVILKNVFDSMKENRKINSTIIDSDAIEILEEIYQKPVTIKYLKYNSERFNIRSGLTYGTYIYEISYAKSKERILINWEKEIDTLEIINIKKDYGDREVIFQR